MKQVMAVVGLGFGDEGKGTITDYLARRMPKPLLNVRFNGGAQAAHNVVLPDGTHHTFSQLGSGSFVPAVTTFLSRHMMVAPNSFFAERAAFPGPTNVFVDDNALVTTPWHQQVNRLIEASRGMDRHGSCGMGVGVTREFSLAGGLPLRVEHLGSQARLAKFVQQFLDWAYDVYRVWAPVIVNELEAFDEVGAAFMKTVTLVDGSFLPTAISSGVSVLFEGAQGVLLDEDYGFHPYTTWSKTTTKNVKLLCQNACRVWDMEVVGVTRTYLTRHGPGPFPTEQLLPRTYSESHNRTGRWQGAFRTGALDLVLLQYALDCCVADGLPIMSLAATHVERSPIQVCVAYRRYPVYPDGLGLEWLIPPRSSIERKALTAAMWRAQPVYEPYGFDKIQRLGLPISVLSDGPTYHDKSSMSLVP